MLGETMYMYTEGTLSEYNLGDLEQLIGNWEIKTCSEKLSVREMNMVNMITVPDLLNSVSVSISYHEYLLFSDWDRHQDEIHLCVKGQHNSCPAYSSKS